MKALFTIATVLLASATVYASDLDIGKWEEGCSKGNGGDCWMLGGNYEVGIGVLPSIEEAIKYYERSCSLKSPRGCCSLGDIYRNGKGVERSYKKS